MTRRPEPKASRETAALRRQVRELRKRLVKVERKCRRCHGEDSGADAIGFLAPQGEKGLC